MNAKERVQLEAKRRAIVRKYKAMLVELVSKELPFSKNEMETLITRIKKLRAQAKKILDRLGNHDRRHKDT